MKIFHVMCRKDDDSDDLHRFDAIDFQGHIWLVPQWLDGPPRAPALMICLTGHGCRRPQPDADYVLNDRLPISAFDGSIRSEMEYGWFVLERPDLSAA